MVDRQRVFEQKVLKKLYSSPPEVRIQEAPTKISTSKQEQKEEERSNITSDSIGDAQIIPVCRKVYTVSLPPSGNELCSTKSNEQREPQDSSGEEPEEEEPSQKFPRKRRRRRKINDSLFDRINKNAPPVLQQIEGLETGIMQTSHLDSAKSEEETLTKNKRRKLKKKRHKEKLKAAGLVPRATAVEFTYQPGEKREISISTYTKQFNPERTMGRTCGRIPEHPEETDLDEMICPTLPTRTCAILTRSAGKVTLSSTDTLMHGTALLLGLLGFSMSYYSTRQMHLQHKSISSFKTGA
ncbi:glutamate-rich protein 1 isoform X1 [Scyliorhinus canicula]|uniref:glutamate-rich protein 1 isoform X1 n=1 Tax=Scyliorhinus canicula TaxID=7830 RepID=UPI0018F41D4B|nr:glutamate-rich protein 1 isoform X1 [Scyliorhinus canicula]